MKPASSRSGGHLPALLSALLSASAAWSGSTPERIYWADPDAHGIFTADLDGSDVETLVQGGDCFRPLGLALDPGNGKMYWTGSLSCSEDGIQRANVDGSAVETLPVATTNPTGIALSGGKIYWIDGPLVAGRVRRANLDGSAAEVLVEAGLYTWDITLDPDAGKIYWTQLGDFLVRRANLDGSDPEDLIEDSRAIAIAIDLVDDELYLAAPGAISRAGLDGTNPETLVEDIGYPQGLALDRLRATAYWTTNLSGQGSKIRRSGLDGPPIEDLIVDLERPKAIALLLASVCGNGVVEAPEDCDDGNNVDGDGCAADCIGEASMPAVSGFGAILLGSLLLAASTAILALRRRRTRPVG